MKYPNLNHDEIFLSSIDYYVRVHNGYEYNHIGVKEISEIEKNIKCIRTIYSYIIEEDNRKIAMSKLETMFVFPEVSDHNDLFSSEDEKSFSFIDNLIDQINIRRKLLENNHSIKHFTSEITKEEILDNRNMIIREFRSIINEQLVNKLLVKLSVNEIFASSENTNLLSSITKLVEEYNKFEFSLISNELLETISDIQKEIDNIYFIIIDPLTQRKAREIINKKKKYNFNLTEYQ